MRLCKKCNKEISNERLEIIPEATECGLCLNKLEYKSQTSSFIDTPIPKPSGENRFMYSFVPVTFNGKKIYTYSMKKFSSLYHIHPDDVTEVLNANHIFYIKNGAVKTIKR